MNSVRSLMGDVSFHGMATPPRCAMLREAVTHVAGLRCYPCRRYRPGTSVTDQTGSMGVTPLSCPPGGGHGVDGDGSREGTAALRGGLGSEAVHGDRAVRPVRR